MSYPKLYGRLSRFKELIECMQGDPGNVPDELLETLQGKTRRELMRELKKLGLRKYYEYITYIDSKVNGTVIPELSEEDKTKMIDLFKKISDCFDELYPDQSFLSLKYVLNKLLKVIGKNKDYFEGRDSVFNNPEREIRCDKIWDAINQLL